MVLKIPTIAPHFAAVDRKLTSAWICEEDRRWEKFEGMIPALKPDWMNAYGCVIAVRMQSWSVGPRIFFEEALAQSLRSR